MNLASEMKHATDIILFLVGGLVRERDELAEKLRAAEAERDAAKRDAAHYATMNCRASRTLHDAPNNSECPSVLWWKRNLFEALNARDNRHRETAAELAAARERIGVLRKAADAIEHECWSVLSGGADGPAETCDGCGLGGIGRLRDLLAEYAALKETP